jgi:2-polyprenyl-3-methyl-5-hydroxy-6-metoxy-1,4-benzoquinol methylase
VTEPYDHLRQFESLAPVELQKGDGDAVTHSLAVLSSVYHYNHWIFSAVRDFVGPFVLEVGAGIGNITQFLLNSESLTCLEPYAPYREYLSKRFEKHQNTRVLPHRIEDCPNGGVPGKAFDTVICLNVLEHIEDDVNALRIFRELLKDGGKAVVLVPAMPIAYGAIDKAMGHYRRYSRRSLRRAFAAAALRPIHSHYMNAVGAAGWFWRGRICRKTTIPESQTRLFDRMVPLISAVEAIIHPPFGQSLVMVGEPQAG